MGNFTIDEGYYVFIALIRISLYYSTAITIGLVLSCLDIRL